MPRAALANPLPPRPRAVLRLGFAGRRELSPEAEENLRHALRHALAIMGRRLAGLTPGSPERIEACPRVAAFFGDQPPLLRLVTGLCEGADTVAAQELARVAITPDGSYQDDAPPRCLETELAAVLPFDFNAYRDSRPAGFRAELDRQAERCGYIVTLDGIHAKPDPDTRVAQERRSKAYRAQSALLLRHADVLLAAADPGEPGKAGGTLETVRTALVFGLPVVFIHTGTGALRLIDPSDDLGSALANPPPDTDTLEASLANLVSRILVAPDPEINQAGGDEPGAEGLRLLREYFDTTGSPPLRRGRDAKLVRKRTWRERCWALMLARFIDGREPKADPPLPAYKPYRDRATSLNYHYSGLYRGAFVLNYGLAVAAVLLATLSLVLIGSAHSGVVDEIHALAAAAEHTVPAAEATALAATPGWLYPVLLALGTLKLGIVIFIARNTHSANHDNWNDLAVDYRYLAERLRALYYLPLAGSFQPPAAAPHQYASRVIHQSAVDWLFNAIARAISPATLAQEELIPAHDGADAIKVKILRLRPLQTLATVRDRWLAEQVVYHARNARAMRRLERFTEGAGNGLSRAVVYIVALDIVIVALDLVHLLPHALGHLLHGFTPWLIFLAAVLPAAVASLNGLRFQSECGRLAERSAMLRVILGGRSTDTQAPESEPEPELTGGRWHETGALAARIAAGADAESEPGSEPGTDIAAWSLDTLLLTERIADDCVREVAEWSVLYAKQLPET